MAVCWVANVFEVEFISTFSFSSLFEFSATETRSIMEFRTLVPIESFALQPILI